MKRWKVLVRCEKPDHAESHMIEVEADSDTSAKCLAVYVAAGIYQNFASYEPVMWFDQSDPRWHERAA